MLRCLSRVLVESDEGEMENLLCTARSRLVLESQPNDEWAPPPEHAHLRC